jgi:hypothetical protein
MVDFDKLSVIGTELESERKRNDVMSDNIRKNFVLKVDIRLSLKIF